MISRLLALSLLLLVLGVVAIGVGLPAWQHYQAQIESIEDARHRIRTYDRIAAARESLRQRQQAVVRQQASERLFIEGSTAALAAANLQRIAAQQVAAVQGRMISTQVMPSVQEGGFQRIGIQVRMRASLPAAYALLESLYESRPALFIDRVSLRQILVRGPTRKGQVLETQLDLGFELRGYLRGAG